MTEFSPWRLNLTDEDRAANLFLSDRGRLGLRAIFARRDDSERDIAIFNKLAAKSAKRETK